MSMDSLLLPVTQPPPEISDEKQLKSVPDKLSELVLEPYIASDTESEYESESESESESEVVPEQEQELLPEQDPELVAEQEPESESEPELDPRADWELIPIEKLTVNDLASRYEDDPSLFSFGCPQFVYKNKAFLKREEDIKKARAEYYKLARGVSNNVATFLLTSPILLWKCLMLRISGTRSSDNNSPSYVLHTISSSVISLSKSPLMTNKMSHNFSHAGEPNVIVPQELVKGENLN
ncbi:uncharacterized protein [Cicer arietinum]|uniref:Uncharacterized protein LOC101494494 isoform X3 n=1 Tax=Cicer arietinum TaxID=3827 RepID=A0A1S3E9W2_CICAR|nr:uncharacterized protein LOC101494494 isoform X3 [Cicer arietinum]